MLELTDLRADCGQCAALCCVLLPYRRVDGFGADKDGGTPCGHLTATNRCGIHDDLRDRGWPGCEVFDCFGAGQWTTRHTYAERGWRSGADRGEMAAVLSVQRLVHEMLWHLDEVVRRAAGDSATRDLQQRLLAVRVLDPEGLLAVDLDALLDAVGDHLDAVDREPRADAAVLRRADLSGRDLRGEQLTDADLRGALLIGADLRGASLGAANLLGADLRGVRLEGTDLGGCWFLTQPQLAAARRDANTMSPPRLRTI